MFVASPSAGHQKAAVDLFVLSNQTCAAARNIEQKYTYSMFSNNNSDSGIGNTNIFCPENLAAAARFHELAS
jgi:hypothetical protein